MLNPQVIPQADAGAPGARAISQLHILNQLMHEINFDSNGDDKRPCDIFDAIGGTGSGGYVKNENKRP